VVKKYRFTAAWCQPCKALAKRLESFNITDLEVIDIDTPEAKELVAKYNIRSVPTIVIDSGDEVSSYVGANFNQMIWEEISK